MDSAQSPNAARSRRLSVEELVEALGFGPAQLRVLFLGPLGNHFCDGAELCLVNMVAMSTAADFGINASEKAALSVISLVGLTLGIWASGFLGDHMGRKPPIVASYALTSLVGFSCAAAQEYKTLLVLRMFLGFGMGLGMAPSLALLSEITPQSWRMKMRVCQTTAFAFGGFVVVLLAALNDATLLKLQWRYLMVAAAIPPAVFFVLTCMYLPESPVWLASVEQRSAAECGFEKIKCLNGSTHCDTRYLSQDKDALCDHSSISGQMKVIVSPPLLRTTLVYLFTSLVLNMIVYGEHYSSPQVFAKISVLEAGWQSLVKLSITMVCNVVLYGVAELLTPSMILVLGLNLCAVSCLSLTYAASMTDSSSILHSVLFQFGANFPIGAANWGFASLFQLCVELYPTKVRSSGSAVIIGGGRLAGIVAPMVVETMWATTGSWQPFYHVVALLAIFASLLNFINEDRSYDERSHESVMISPEVSYGGCRSA